VDILYYNIIPAGLLISHYKTSLPYYICLSEGTCNLFLVGSLLVTVLAHSNLLSRQFISIFTPLDSCTACIYMCVITFLFPIALAYLVGFAIFHLLHKPFKSYPINTGTKPLEFFFKIYSNELSVDFLYRLYIMYM